MNKINKIILSMIIAISSIALIMPINKIDAAGFSVSASTSSVNANGSFTFYVGGSVTGRFNISASNGSVSASSVWVENNTQAITVYAGSSGTVTVSATAVDVSDSSYNAVTGTQSVSVSIVSGSSSGGSSSNNGGSNEGTSGNTHYEYNEETGENEEVKDEENKTDLSLKSLSISKGTLSPAFNVETTAYLVELTSDIKSITIKAEANNKDATVDGTGEHKLNSGENSIDIKVSDSEGNSKVYNIKVNVEAKPSIYLEGLNNDKLGILSLKSAPALTHFEEYKFKIGNKEVIGKRNSINKLVVLYMIDEDNNRNYYIYDEKKKKITSIYIPISLLGKNYAVITIPEKYKNITGYTFGKIKVDGQSYNGWIFKDNKYKNYSLLYLMDENAEVGFYQYEKVSNTLQPFSGVAPIDQKEYEELKNKETIMYGLFVVCGVMAVCLLMFLIVFIKVKKSLKKKLK